MTSLEVGRDGCFDLRVQALSDEQQIDRVEQKVDRLEQKTDRLDAKIDARASGLESRIAGVHAEAREDFRMLLAAQLTTLVAMILGFAGLFLQMS